MTCNRARIFCSCCATDVIWSLWSAGIKNALKKQILEGCEISSAQNTYWAKEHSCLCWKVSFVLTAQIFRNSTQDGHWCQQLAQVLQYERTFSVCWSLWKLRSRKFSCFNCCLSSSRETCTNSHANTGLNDHLSLSPPGPRLAHWTLSLLQWSRRGRTLSLWRHAWWRAVHWVL